MAELVSQVIGKHGRGPDKVKRRPRNSKTGKPIISSLRQLNQSKSDNKKTVASVLKGGGTGGGAMKPHTSGKTWQGRDV